MNEHYIYQLMVKHLQQSISNTEQTELDKALIDNDELKKEFGKLKDAWSFSGNYKEDLNLDVNTAWTKVRKQIETEAPAKVVPFYRTNWAAAAAVVVLLAMGFLVYMQFSEPVWKQVATTNENKELHLPDGSTIWLNRQSSCSYPANFSHNRQVKLSGEAFFEVTKDAAHPFVISAQGTQTQVVGTSFNVRAYNNENNIQVSVTTGKVWFSAAEEKLILTPGERGSFSAAKGLEKLKTEDNYLAWKTGELVFNHSSLPLVLNDLQKYYSIQLNIKDSSVTSVSFSGRLNRQPLNAALEILKSSMGLRITRDSAQSWSVYSK